MHDGLISLYRSIAPFAAIFAGIGFAATFTFNNTFAQFRTNLYESAEYGVIAKKLQSLDPKPMRCGRFAS